MCGTGAGSSLMVRWQGHRRLLRPAMSPGRLMHPAFSSRSHIHTSLSAGLLKQHARLLHWRVTSILQKGCDYSEETILGAID